MIKDMDGHKILLAEEGNGHILVYGGSGQGKTFFLCRMLGEYNKMGKKALVIDFSGSYTEKELLKQGVHFGQDIERFVPFRKAFCWNYRVSDSNVYKKDVTDALVEALGCKGYFQKKLLGEAVGRTIQGKDGINIPAIVENLEAMAKEKEEDEQGRERVENLNRLLTRMQPYEGIEGFYIMEGHTEDKRIKPITIIDVTDFPEGQRKFLARLIVALFWREVYRQDTPNRCGVLLLDEMQFLPVGEGSALSSMLREGRKKGVELVLSTQYISHYGKSELQALQQAGNIVVFRPTLEDGKRSAKLIDGMHEKEWERILGKLKKGEAVLKGAYRIDSRNKLSFDPIIIRIEK